MDAEDEDDDVEGCIPRKSNAVIDGGGFFIIVGGLFTVDRGGSLIAELSLRDTVGRSNNRALW
jgi:hypothetical protein